MSDSTNFCTFESMQGALVYSASSEQPLHPAEHAIAPLEPNFAWEANQSNTNHQLVIVLPESRTIGGVLFIHHEAKTINIAVEHSANGSSWTPVSNLAPSWGNLSLLHIRYLWNTSPAGKTTRTAKYWRITFYGATAPNYYPPFDMRVSACWLFSVTEITQRAHLPINEQVIFPINTQILPFGKQYVTGKNVNQSLSFSRVWTLTDIQRTTLWQVINRCRGALFPFILYEYSLPRLCRFNPSAITESLIDIGLTSITAQLTEIPIVKLNARH